MNQIAALLVLAVLLSMAAGCTQPEPAPVPATPVPEITATAVETALQVTTLTAVPKTSSSVSDNTVRIEDNKVDPETITVPAGATVRWVNYDSFPHRIVFVDKSFSPTLMGASQSYSQVFFRPGVYDYSCSIHPEMQGTVIVK
jgi:plastocyanin